MQPSSTPRASTCCEVRLAHADIPVWVGRRRRIWTFILSQITPWPGFLPYDYEPKHECHVEVRRRADHRLVVSYDYNQELDAIEHVRSLRERAEQMSIADFDRELGLRSSW